MCNIAEINHILIISHRSIRRRNFLCFWNSNILMNSSANMLIVEIYLTLIFWFLIFWFSQCLCTSTCFNLMMYAEIELIKIRIVCVLLHWITDVWSNRKKISSKNLIHQINFFFVIEIASNSISMKLMMTVFCLKTFQSTKSTNNLNS